MLLNAEIAISTSKVLLVPYSAWHVPRYHEWMKDEQIQEATASEPLTLEEEYAMQRSWRQDPDKLTFITCRPVLPPANEATIIQVRSDHDSPENMVGDINLFLRIDDGDEGNSPPQIVGEIELMVAEKANQRRGFGKASLLVFMKYIAERRSSILAEFVAGGVDAATVDTLKTAYPEGLEFSCLSVKIGQANERSLALFQNLGFVKMSEEPNFFGEFELRRTDLSCTSIDQALAAADIKDFVEISYERKG